MHRIILNGTQTVYTLDCEDSVTQVDERTIEHGRPSWWVLGDPEDRTRLTTLGTT